MVSAPVVSVVRQEAANAELQPDYDFPLEAHLVQDLSQTKVQDELPGSPDVDELLKKRGKGQWKCKFGSVRIRDSYSELFCCKR
jgi:hypothetical protein